MSMPMWTPAERRSSRASERCNPLAQIERRTISCQPDGLPNACPAGHADSHHIALPPCVRENGIDAAMKAHLRAQIALKSAVEPSAAYARNKMRSAGVQTSGQCGSEPRDNIIQTGRCQIDRCKCAVSRVWMVSRMVEVRAGWRGVLLVRPTAQGCMPYMPCTTWLFVHLRSSTMDTAANVLKMGETTGLAILYYLSLEIRVFFKGVSTGRHPPYMPCTPATQAGSTPLSEAVRRGATNMARLLLVAGARHQTDVGNVSGSK
jgi:hypothetical protein